MIVKKFFNKKKEVGIPLGFLLLLFSISFVFALNPSNSPYGLRESPTNIIFNGTYTINTNYSDYAGTCTLFAGMLPYEYQSTYVNSTFPFLFQQADSNYTLIFNNITNNRIEALNKTNVSYSTSQNNSLNFCTMNNASSTFLTMLNASSTFIKTSYNSTYHNYAYNQSSIFATYDFETSGRNVSLLRNYTLSDDVLDNNQPDNSATSGSSIKLKETRIDNGLGVNPKTIRIKYDFFASGGPGVPIPAASFDVRRNGVIVGLVQTAFDGDPYTTFSEDISGWKDGDLVQVYGSMISGTNMSVRNLTIAGKIEINEYLGNFTNLS